MFSLFSRNPLLRVIFSCALIRCEFSSSKSSTASETKNTAINQQVGAAENGIAAGVGATVSIENLDAGLAAQVAMENGEVSARAIQAASDTAARSIAQQGETAGRAFNFAGDVAGRALDSNTEISARAINLGDDVSARSLDTLVTLGQNQQNFAQKTISDVSSNLVRNAGEATSAVLSDAVKTGLYVMGAVAVVVGIAYAVKTSKKS